MSDGTYFYNRTIYPRIATPVPDCFLELDKHFAAIGITQDRKFLYSVPILTLAENLCRRMADIDYYAEAISASLADATGAFAQAKVVGTLLVGYFGACKSVLDAIALAIDDLFGLGLSGGNCDLRKAMFWNRLV